MNLSVLPHFRPLWEVYRYKVLLSGRGSAKSTHVAIYLLYVASRVTVLVLCLREYMSSIADSSKAQLEHIIAQSGTAGHWHITKTEIVHKVTGSRFVFKGIAHNTSNIKSFAKADICWVEECENITSDSLEILIPTIREPGSQIIFSGNVKDRLQAVAQKFIENEPPPGTVIIANCYLDNPYISNTLLAEANHMRDTNPELYSHIWLGNYLETGNMVLCSNVVRATGTTLPSDKVIIGVDCAREGGDSTVYCVRKGRTILEEQVHPKMTLTPMVHILQDLIRRYKPERINLDETGHGAWAPDGIIAMGIDVQGVNFSSASRDPRKYANIRSELYGLAAEYFDHGGTIRPHDIELEKDLRSSYYTLDSKSRIAIIPKDEIRKRVGRSPDRSDAFCLSLLVDGDMFRSNKNEVNLAAQLLSAELAKAGEF